ncbi:MAG: hypothetical protein M0Z66_00525 [Thermaerobacter sp.]|nr:hypothetical protein [Thermaerobacter sp.]
MLDLPLAFKERQAVLRELAQRYGKARKSEKGALLDRGNEAARLQPQLQGAGRRPQGQREGDTFGFPPPFRLVAQVSFRSEATNSVQVPFY